MLSIIIMPDLSHEESCSRIIIVEYRLHGARRLKDINQAKFRRPKIDDQPNRHRQIDTVETPLTQIGERLSMAMIKTEYLTLHNGLYIHVANIDRLSSL